MGARKSVPEPDTGFQTKRAACCLFFVRFVPRLSSMLIADIDERVDCLVGLNSASIAPLHCNARSNARRLLFKAQHLFLCPSPSHAHHLGGTPASPPFKRERERERARARERERERARARESEREQGREEERELSLLPPRAFTRCQNLQSRSQSTAGGA